MARLAKFFSNMANKPYKSKACQQFKVAHLSTMYSYVNNFQSGYLFSSLFSLECFQRKHLKIYPLFFGRKKDMENAKGRTTSFVSAKTPQW